MKYLFYILKAELTYAEVFLSISLLCGYWNDLGDTSSSPQGVRLYEPGSF